VEKYEFAGDTDAALIEDIELNCMESSKEKRMVISLILFRCAKHSFFFIIVFLQFSIKFCFSGCLFLITNSKLVFRFTKM
jgi:hypothetical protein